MKKVAWRALLVILSVGLLIGYALLLWQGPWWFDGEHLRDKNLQPADGVVITGFRTMLVALGVAVTAGIGLVYTHRNHQHALEQFEHTREKDREQAEMTREGQVTGRYVEAIKLLAARDSGGEGPRLTERLGGIYALERIMRDSEKDHDTVVQVLAAFQAPVPDPWLPDTREGFPGPKDDVQAALTVLGRRPNRAESQRLDLSFTALWRVDLSGARLEGVNLSGAELQNADLRDANLKGARLEAVELKDAEMAGADLRAADLVGDRVAAKLEMEQLMQTVFDQHTKLPLNLAHRPEVKKALEA